jgi:hypothetical protein
MCAANDKSLKIQYTYMHVPVGGGRDCATNLNNVYIYARIELYVQARERVSTS